MDIQNDLDGFFDGKAAAPAVTQQAKSNTANATGSSSLNGDRETSSDVGSGVTSIGAEPDVRLDKVSAVQAALASGTYNIPASAVAAKVVESMLGGGQ